jgi:LemA protein
MEILLGVLVVIVVLVVLVYNGLIRGRNMVDNAWSQIDVQLKKRFDLVPNLVETVKGYAKHEREVFQKVTEARSAMMGAKSVGDKAKANNMLTDALKTVFAVAEAYPKLEASANFKELQEELSDIEGKIAYARQFYNDATLEYNNSIQTVPNNLIAGPFGFNKKDFFEVEAEGRKAVKVKFD